MEINAAAIRAQGRLIKAWKENDGSWYTDKYQIWKVGDKYFQIKDHEGNSFSCTCSKYGEVTEVEPIQEPTHICIIIGQQEGRAYIAQQKSGILSELIEWAAKYIQENNMLYRGYTRVVDQHLEVRFLPIEL